jgi:hypothetical protein
MQFILSEHVLIQSFEDLINQEDVTWIQADAGYEAKTNVEAKIWNSKYLS